MYVVIQPNGNSSTSSTVNIITTLEEKGEKKKPHLTETSVLFTSANFVPIGLCMCFPPMARGKLLQLKLVIAK